MGTMLDNLVLYQLPSLSMAFIIGFLIQILISSLILWLSVKLVGGYADFKKTVLFSIIMQVLNLVVFPLIPSPFSLFSIVLYAVIWLVLVMKFFDLSLGRAIIVAVLQVVVGIVLGILGLIAIIGTLVALLS